MSTPPAESLSRMQLDVLSVLAERSRIGADVASELADQYDESPHPSTVYHHLDALVSEGLVEKRDAGGSDRARDYRITDTGRRVIRGYVADLTVRIQAGEFREY